MIICKMCFSLDLVLFCLPFLSRKDDLDYLFSDEFLITFISDFIVTESELPTDADLARVSRVNQPKELVPFYLDDHHIPVEYGTDHNNKSWSVEAMFEANKKLQDRESDFDPEMKHYTYVFAF